jgi:hypothetical protein
MKDEKGCTHKIWAKGFPLELVGISRQENLALVFCSVCMDTFFIEFESWI